MQNVLQVSSMQLLQFRMPKLSLCHLDIFQSQSVQGIIKLPFQEDCCGRKQKQQSRMGSKQSCISISTAGTSRKDTVCEAAVILNVEGERADAPADEDVFDRPRCCGTTRPGSFLHTCSMARCLVGL